ncbi:twin-arginine translocase subunit TatC [Alistipes sp. An116]|uniref:twin-arginine translocase subunit TatC n=1 Tax=Alistipes sp. An116 TaxID=1965546 RepID=UPI000B399607|nr:twin-arginine translocase subunit TatC [Alistipes sp. An116]OUQ51059.1 twin-arginine translocase subunit TatC [Alistipes sp. An116]
MQKTDMTFWEHLDVLRVAIVKIIAVSVVFGVVAFFFKEQLFDVILAPKQSDFITYRVFNMISSWVGGGSEAFIVRLINTGLAQQFVIHMKTALCAGILCTSPYILYQLFWFVSPALYENERRYVMRVVGGGYAMFGIGVLVSYFLIFPLTFRFLGTYQVSRDVDNLITLDSYISTLMLMSLTMGLVFEIPILSWLFAKLGFLTDRFMRRYRKHAIIIILVVAAIITPTSDVFTLLLVACPMWLLYEMSILIVKNTLIQKNEITAKT